MRPEYNIIHTAYDKALALLASLGWDPTTGTGWCCEETQAGVSQQYSRFGGFLAVAELAPLPDATVHAVGYGLEVTVYRRKDGEYNDLAGPVHRFWWLPGMDAFVHTVGFFLPTVEEAKHLRDKLSARTAEVEA